MTAPHGSPYLGDGTPRQSAEARREAHETLIADTAYDSFESLGPPHTDTRCPACDAIVEDTYREKRSHLSFCVGEPSIMALAASAVAP